MKILQTIAFTLITFSIFLSSCIGGDDLPNASTVETGFTANNSQGEPMSDEQKELLMGKPWRTKKVVDNINNADSTAAFEGFFIKFETNGNYQHDYQGDHETGTYSIRDSYIYLYPHGNQPSRLGKLDDVTVTANDLQFGLNYFDSNGQEYRYRVELKTK